MSFADKAVLDALRRLAPPIALKQGYPVAQCFKDLNLVEIPDAMDKKGFTVGAALMRRWFLGKAFTMPETWKYDPQHTFDHRGLAIPYVDTQTVTMQWALRYGRTLAAYQEVKQAILGQLAESSLAASKKELFKRLLSAGKFSQQPTTFGSGPVMALHETAHVNSRVVSANNIEKLTDPLDDLYCALGAFVLHVAAAGIVTPLGKQTSGNATHEVRVQKLGFYIRDSYDFNGNQPLGAWSADEVRRMPSFRFAMVENASFRQWRLRHKRGGDFIIFSDVRWENLSQPLIWTYAAK